MGKFKTKNQQIKILRDKNVLTPSGSCKLLLETNYNEIVKKYGKIFIDIPKSSASQKYKKIYKDNTSVQEMYSLLKFDRKLASIVMYEILDIEEKVKSVFVYYTCEIRGEYAVYKKDSYDQNMPLDKIVENINYMHSVVNKNRHKHFIQDDFGKYGYVPFYVVSEFITLGELYKLMESIDPRITLKVAKHFSLNVRQLKSFINLLSKFRNACAHNDVVYCYNFQKASIAPTSVHSKWSLNSGDQNKYNHNLFACLIVIKHFKKKKEYVTFINQIDNMLNSLDKKCSVIDKNQILNYAGIPLNYKEMLIK